MDKKYRFHILDGGNTTIAEMTISEMIVFIKIFGGRFEIFAIE